LTPCDVVDFTYEKLKLLLCPEDGGTSTLPHGATF